MNYDIGISYREDMPEHLVSDLVQELQKENVKVEVEKRENAPFIALEWAIPAAIFIYIVKPFIDELLKEAAKDSCPAIKKSISEFAKKILKIKQQTIVSSQSPNKVQKDNPVSGVFAIWSVTADGRPIKFLFYRDRDEGFYEYCIEKAFDVLMNHTLEYPNDNISNQVVRLPRRSREIYLLFDEAEREWKVVDILTGLYGKEQ